MTPSGPDWAGIRAELWRAIARYWPLLLVGVCLELAIYFGGVTLLGEAQELEAGVTGYLGYLKRQAYEFLPGALLYTLILAVILNGLSDRPVGRGTILSRAMRAMPTALVVSVLTLAPFLASTVLNYTRNDNAGWWIAYWAGPAGFVAVLTICGFATQEAIARGLGPLAAIRASAALTFSHRAWLAWVYLGLEVGFEVLRLVSDPLNGLVTDRGIAALGAYPMAEGLRSLGYMITLPLDVVLYFELRRLQSEDGSWLGAIFD